MERKRICICGDSRVKVQGPNTTWGKILANENLGLYEFDYTHNGHHSFTTMWDHIDDMKRKNQYYDLGIFQLGYHEYVVPWKMTVWRSLNLPEDELINSLTKVQDSYIGSHLLKDCYCYRNDKVIKRLFLEARVYYKKLLFIQMPYTWDHFLERTIMMNDVYSKFCDDSIPLPLDESFPKEHSLYDDIDRVHYKDEYHRVIADLVLDRIRNLI